MQLSHVYLSKALENMMKLAGNVAYLMFFTPLVSAVIQQKTSYEGCIENCSIMMNFYWKLTENMFLQTVLKLSRIVTMSH